MSQTQIVHMNLPDRVSEVVRSSLQLKRGSEDALITALRSELTIVRTLCLLARQENGNKRSYHLEQAKKELDTAIELASRFKPGKRERDEVEEVRQDLLSVDLAPSST